MGRALTAVLLSLTLACSSAEQGGPDDGDDGGDGGGGGGGGGGGSSGWSSALAGAALNGPVIDLAASGDGTLYILTSSTTVAGQPVDGLAKYKDGTWTAIGGITYFTSGGVRYLEAQDLYLHGDYLYLMGLYDSIGGQAIANLARYHTGTGAFEPVGAGGPEAPDCGVYGAAALHGKIYFGGCFSNVGGIAASRVAAWDPGSGAWSALDGPTGTVSLMYAHGNELIAGGQSIGLTSTGLAHGVVRYNPSDGWRPLGTGTTNGVGDANAAASWNGKLIVGGLFQNLGGGSAGPVTNNIAAWDSATNTWSTMGGGVENEVADLVVVGNQLYAVGDIAVAGGSSAAGVARYDLTLNDWFAMGPAPAYGLGSGFVNGYALASWGDNVAVGGYFSTAGGVASPHLALWVSP